MSTARRKAGTVGDQLTVPDPVQVTRPDGYASTHTGGLLVLSQGGTWVIDGTEIAVTDTAAPAAPDEA